MNDKNGQTAEVTPPLDENGQRDREVAAFVETRSAMINVLRSMGAELRAKYPGATELDEVLGPVEPTAPAEPTTPATAAAEVMQVKTLRAEHIEITDPKSGRVKAQIDTGEDGHPRIRFFGTYGTEHEAVLEICVVHDDWPADDGYGVIYLNDLKRGLSLTVRPELVMFEGEDPETCEVDARVWLLGPFDGKDRASDWYKDERLRVTTGDVGGVWDQTLARWPDGPLDGPPSDDLLDSEADAQAVGDEATVKGPGAS